MTDTELDTALRNNELELRRLTAERAAIITRIERRGIWAIEHRSMAGYLRATLNCSSSDANRDRRRSHLLHLHPALADAVRAGRIAPAHIDQIIRIGSNRRISHLLPTIIDVLIDLAEHTSHHEYTTQITHLIAQLDTDGAFADLSDAVDGRRATVAEVGGQIVVNAHGGDPIQAAQLQAIFEQFVDVEHRNDLEARRAEHGDQADQQPLPRSHAQRSFDALAAIFRAAHAAPHADGLPTTIVNIVVDSRTVHDVLTHAGITLSDRTQVVLDHRGHPQRPDTTPAQRFAADLLADPETFLTRRCTTPNGSPIHPSVLLRSLLTDHVRRVVVDSRRVVTDLGTTSRLFTGSARTAALLLADRCEFPGCTIPKRRAQVDHNHEHHDGGPTDQHNANIACGHHNRVKHRQGWTIRRDQRGRAYTLRPDGSIILPVGERPPDLTIDELTRCARQRIRTLTPMAANAGQRD